jgi:hypothetical protein
MPIGLSQLTEVLARSAVTSLTHREGVKGRSHLDMSKAVGSGPTSRRAPDPEMLLPVGVENPIHTALLLATAHSSNSSSSS